MNFFEIINAVLLELNYSQVADFADLTKLEHKQIMNIINRLNKDICNMNNKFSFRQLTKNLQLYTDRTEYKMQFSGKIAQIIGENIIYQYEPDYTKFHLGTFEPTTYSVYGDKLLFAPSDELVKIFYSTDLFVKDKNNTFKSNFENETDKSILPDNFVEKLFVNGASYNFKQNTSHPKYIHWKQEYEKVLSALLSEAKATINSNIVLDGGYRKL